jgi:hypothetical protein|uniref:Ankyrin repeat protein n=1 Tax=viral metagenome TaxID=1070528 RepID=A0A6C0IVC6_9ZZZZ
MIDFKKISNINTKKDINKYKIDEPIFLNNYLFHYLIMTNNLKAMKLIKHPIYKENDEGLTGFHLAAKVTAETKSLDMLKYLLKSYPDYASNINFANHTFLDYLQVSDKIIEIIEYNKEIEWVRILTNVSDLEDQKNNFIHHVFRDGSLKLITFIISIIYGQKFKLSDLSTCPTFELPSNPNLKIKNIINIIEQLSKLEKCNVLEVLDSQGKSIIYPTILSQKIDLLEYIIKNNIDTDKYTSIYTLHPFINSYIYETLNKSGKNKYKMSELLWNNIKDTHNFISTNKYGENLAFSIIRTRLVAGTGNLDIELDILKRNTLWNNYNVDKVSILHILIQLSFDDYHKVIKNIKIDVFQTDADGKTILDHATDKWLMFLKTLEKIDTIKCSDKECVIIDEYKFANANTFSSTILDAGLFLIYFNNKYTNLYIPKYIDKVDNDMYWDNGFNFPDNFINEYNNFPWVIYWQDKYNYHIHPHLNQLINANKNKDKYNHATVLLSVLLPHGGLHAMILYYDFENNFIERFDPYGNTHDIDGDIDIILEEELTWNTGLYYLNVKKYLPVAGFQNLSDENNSLFQKPGDFGGYCLAWCLWYLEHRMKNYKFTAKTLIAKSIDKLLKRENSLFEFIRNYANNLDKHRQEMLIKIGIPKNRTTNQKFKANEDKLIFEYVKKHTTIN